MVEGGLRMGPGNFAVRPGDWDENTLRIRVRGCGDDGEDDPGGPDGDSGHLRHIPGGGGGTVDPDDAEYNEMQTAGEAQVASAQERELKEGEADLESKRDRGLETE